MKKITISMIGLVLALPILSACSSPSVPKTNSASEVYHNAPTAAKGALIGGTAGNVAGAVIGGGASNVFTFGILGAVAGGMFGAYLDKYSTNRELLERYNVQVVQAGDYVKLVIPSSQLFVGESGQLTTGARSTLDKVVHFAKPLHKISMHVSAFTVQSDKALSASQAASVARYLWAGHIDARLMTTMGYGNDGYYEDAGYFDGSNNRVEITFRDLSNS